MKNFCINFLIDTFTVFQRDWIVLKRRLVKFILSRMVAPILYLVAFGWGLGKSIDFAGGSYLDFLVPGILALNSMNIAFNSITPIHAERVYHKSLEEYILAPIVPESFVFGKILSAILRAMISSSLILILAWIFGARIDLTPILILTLILNSTIFAGIGFIAAMKIDTYEEMAQVNTYILLPMSFLCGTFFRTSTLPDVIKFAIDLLPLTHASYLLRAPNISSLFILIFYATLVLLLSCHAFRRLTD